tara:strand:- start:14 stop:1072 length:1059 start_codon:yes stop_codon:yes gene_type:complete
MLENFSKQKLRSILIFPDRGNFDKSYDSIKDFYQIENNFEVKTYKHYLPFNFFKYLEKLNFLISSFLWSIYGVMKVRKIIGTKDIIMTRTHWIAYFSSIFPNLIIYECHKFSKIDNFIFKRMRNKKNVVIIFPNKNLEKSFEINDNLKTNSLILNSSFNENFFENIDVDRVTNRVVFVGSLLRFNQLRNINFLIDAFSDDRLEKFELCIVGGPIEIVEKLKKEVSSENVTLIGPIPQKEAIREILKSEIGILINDSDTHSKFHTSPLKYFEYLRGGTKVLAVNYPSHKLLPLNENNYYFEPNDKESFIQNILKASKAAFYQNDEIINFSYENRVKKLLKHLARLEGFEPPTL